jgi:hypothetical protein
LILSWRRPAAALAQPGLGGVADLFGYPASFLTVAGVQALAVPFALLARRENASSDPIIDEDVGASSPHL